MKVNKTLVLLLTLLIVLAIIADCGEETDAQTNTSETIVTSKQAIPHSMIERVRNEQGRIRDANKCV